MSEVLLATPHTVIDIDRARDEATVIPLVDQPFVLSSQPETSIETEPNSRLSQMDAVGTGRGRTRSKPERLSLNALPDFQFGSATASPLETPSNVRRSPNRPTPPVHLPASHRRNGSEYVGGDITRGGPMLVSTSPKKDTILSHNSINDAPTTSERIGNLPLVEYSSGETTGSTAPNTRLGLSTHRRGHGHAHRRSGAISNHDLSMILKPAAEGKAGSAPTTPSDPIFQSSSPPELDRSISQPILTTASQELPDDVTKQDIADVGGQSRSRTRFSERLEFVPRPLSTISSETSSSMSTIRASHSLNDSISSMVSGVVPSSPKSSHPPDHIRSSTDKDLGRARSKTAEKSPRPKLGSWDLHGKQPERMVQRPLTAPSDDTIYQGSQHSNVLAVSEGALTSKQPHISRPLNAASTRAQIIPDDGTNLYNSRERCAPSTDVFVVRPRTSPEPNMTQRQGRGKSWSGLLSRKAKDQDPVHALAPRRPQPSQSQPSTAMEPSLDDINFDEDTTCIIESGVPYDSRPSGVTNEDNHWRPPEPGSSPELGSSASVLDIDAALSSTEGTTLGPSFEEVVGGAPAAAPRRMHSSGTTGGFAGPGMHYHRQTESAPEMEAVDRSRFGFPRLGSNPAMAIEEEEEGEDEEDMPSAQVNTPSGTDWAESQKGLAPGLGVNVVEAATANNQPMQRSRRRPVQGMLADGGKFASTLRPGHYEELGQVEIVQADEEPRFSIITKSSDESTITPTLSPDPLDTDPMSTPVEFHLPTSALTGGTSDSSSAGLSPDFIKTSFDNPRMHTATSSITDRSTLNSSRAGDHSLGLHGSVDDVPSLTSSASTMSAHPPRFSISASSTADRSASVSAAARPRPPSSSAHKRLSLASLSRLAGSSYNRSKLNIEETAPADTVERAEKKKGNRLSRMMKKFRTKDKS